MGARARRDWDADGEFIPGSDEEGGGRWQFDRAGAARRLGAGLGGGPLPRPVHARSATSLSSPTWRRNGRGCASGSSDGSEALNLFGYTGVGTLAMAATGASLVHVDASKKSVEAGKANAALSGMADRPIRWLVDDAAKFTAREVRRGRRYDGIILDPPKYGRGPTARSGGSRKACPA